MIGSTRAIRVWARAAPTDLRKGFYGLYELVRTRLGKDPLSGDCYLFVNARRTSAKVLLWDGTGLCVYFKRLEAGRFARLWGGSEGQPLALTQSELALFLEGTRLAGKLPLSPREIKL
jgi:transposase